MDYIQQANGLGEQFYFFVMAFAENFSRKLRICINFHDCRITHFLKNKGEDNKDFMSKFIND